MMKKFRLDRRHRLFKIGYTVGLRIDANPDNDPTAMRWATPISRKIKHACTKMLGSEYDDLFASEPHTTRWRSYWGRRYPNLTEMVPFHHSRPFFIVFQNESDMIMVLLSIEN